MKPPDYKPGSFRKRGDRAPAYTPPSPRPPRTEIRQAVTQEPVRPGLSGRVCPKCGTLLAILILVSLGSLAHADTSVVTAPQGGQQVHLFPFGPSSGGGGTGSPLSAKDPPCSAVGNGAAPDAAALNRCLAGGNRTVLIPCGTYQLEDTLLVDDNTTIQCQPGCTVLMRSNTVAHSPAYANCVPDPDAANRDGIRNRANDCGTSHITIRDCILDGSLITDGPLTGMSGSELAIHLGAATDTVLENVWIQNWPQDGIHFRNGARNRITGGGCTGFGLLWGNAGCINYEVHTDANAPSADPLVVDGVTVVADGPAFCSNNFALPCDQDATCGAGTCIGGGNVAISANAVDNGAQAPAMIVTNSTISLANYHPGIICNYARECILKHNVIRAVATRAGGLAGFEKRMRGIQCFYTASGTRPTNRNCEITGNQIIGDATVASASPILPTNRVQGGILVQGDGATTGGVIITSNLIDGFDLGAGEAGIRVDGVVNADVSHNTVSNILNGDAAIRVGSSTAAAANIVAAGNVIGPLTGATTDGYQLQEVTGFRETGTRFIGPLPAKKFEEFGTNTDLVRSTFMGSFTGGTSPNTIPADNTTRFFGLTTFAAPTITETDIDIPMRPMMAYSMGCAVSIPPDNGAGSQSRTFLFRINGSNTSPVLGCSITETAKFCEDSEEGVFVTTGAKVDWAVTGVNTPAATEATCTLYAGF